jgi:putative flippase GtrA
MAAIVTFTKAQIASVLATGVDFLVTFLLVQEAGVWYLAAGAAGTISGGITHFLVSRSWVFEARDGKWQVQVAKYLLVWLGNLLLNVSVLFLLTHYTGMNYLLAKVIIAVGIAVFYNYVLQKRYVFK